MYLLYFIQVRRKKEYGKISLNFVAYDQDTYFAHKKYVQSPNKQHRKKR